MKKAIFKFDWLTKVALFLTLLLFCNGQAFAGRSIVSSSQKIAKDNVNKVKDSALDLLDEFKTIRDELANAPSDIMNEGKMVGEMKAKDATQENIMALILQSGRGA